ncbi:MAG: DUF1800 family protein [Candidatus Sulfotelmatobacter sp.]
MRSRLTWLSACVLCLSLASTVPHLSAKKKEKAAGPSSNEQKRAVHALNRLAFGPRPGDVQQVMAMGVDRWIDLQLHPEKIQDKGIEARLEPFRTLHMSAKEIAEELPDNQMVKQVIDGKRPMPSDPARRAIYRVQMARLEAKIEQRDEAKQQRQESASASQHEESASPKPDEPAASDSAKTAEELAAAASADAAPSSAPASENSTNAMSGAGNDRSMKADASAEMAPPPETTPTPEEAADAKAREDRLFADLKVQSLYDLPPDSRYKKVMAMTPEEQIAFADTLRGGKGQDVLDGMDPRQREVLLAMNNPQLVVMSELSEAKLLRAIYSERQLEEGMTDFWFNHFNVFIGKGPERLMVTTYEQDVIRPRAMGKFEDLLVAVAKSPAMLFYLDNWQSVGANSMQAQGIPARPYRYGPYGRPRRFPPPRPRKKQNIGLNENYGRELLELHTLSVNGGYSQRDVTEVAKVFTGWTIERPFDGGGFVFDPRKHEPGPKFVLGRRIKPNGEAEGREVLHMLATSPQTAHFISLKLAQRFVSDDPPPALVDRMAKTFEKKKGDIREVLSTLFHSPEFWDESSYRAKVKTPFEFVASAVRATGADVENAMPLARQLNTMGMPLYGAQPPTGYSMKAETWVSSSALLNRMNFALALTTGKVHGVKIDTAQLEGSPPSNDSVAVLSAMEATLLASEVSKQTHDSIVAQMETPSKPAPVQGNMPAKPPDAGTIAGLLLGSPEFQRR